MKKVGMVAVIITLLISLSICTEANENEPALSDGLIMHYTFDEALENNVIRNSSAKGADYNALSTNVSVGYGVARFPYGESFITLPEHYATEFTKNYTVSMWIKLDSSFVGSDSNINLFNFGGNMYSNHQLVYNSYRSEMRFLDRGTSLGASDWALETEVKFVPDEWTHITFVYDFGEKINATVYLYINGEMVGESNSYSLARTLFDAVGKSSTKGYFGRSQFVDITIPNFTGKMDDIRMYNRAISADEILYLYNNVKPPEPVDVRIALVDIYGNEIKSFVSSADSGDTFTVDKSMKNEFVIVNDGVRRRYSYLPEKSTESILVSEDSESNVCKLVFRHEASFEEENLISNPSFEEGVDFWTGGIVEKWSQSTDIFYEGEHSLGWDTKSSLDDTFVYKYIPIEQGKVYRLKYKEYSPGIMTGARTICSVACVVKANAEDFKNPENHLITECGGHSSYYNEKNDILPLDLKIEKGWNEREYVFDTRDVPEAKYILIAYERRNVYYEFYIDDFSLVELESPSFLNVNATNEYVEVNILGAEQGGKVCAVLLNEDVVQEVVVMDASEYLKLSFMQGKAGDSVRLLWLNSFNCLNPVVAERLYVIK